MKMFEEPLGTGYSVLGTDICLAVTKKFLRFA